MHFARAAGLVKILGVFDLERNASVNFRAMMVPKGKPQGIIDKLAVSIPQMFGDTQVGDTMKASGSPLHLMTATRSKPCGLRVK